MRNALVFTRSQKISTILLILLSCASLFLRQESTSSGTYLLAILGWPLIIFCLNLIQNRKLEYVTKDQEQATDSAQKDSK
ncbi:MAG TPA: hypothetical protein DE179_05010 [Oceanospirillaceae bacterium]|nr:hypothetical protein [Oceanospirillaceae bacterium]